jgi:pimeloyl-ACP methyl ester carboxylesterase
MVLLHGLNGFSYDWTRVARGLETTARVVALDLRGFGDSERAPDGAYALSDFSADIDAVARELSLGRFTLVGHSLGGRIAMYYAATRPDAVSALVLLDAVPEMNPSGSRVVRERLAASPESYESVAAATAASLPQFAALSAEELDARMREYLIVNDDGRAAIKRDPAFVKQMPGAYISRDREHERSFWSLVGEVRAPAVLVRGTRSAMVTPELAERLATEIPSLSVVELDASHNLPADAPDALVHTIRSFLVKQRHYAYRT